MSCPIPLSSRSGEIVVDYATRSGAQIARLERGESVWKRVADGSLLAGRAWELDPMTAEDILDEAGAVEAGARRFSPVTERVPM
jgi:hypothetical protein